MTDFSRSRKTLLMPPLMDPPVPTCAVYVPGQTTNVYVGSITVTVQEDLDLLIGYDGMIGDLTLDVDFGAFGLDWSPLVGLKEIDGALYINTYHVADLPPLPALKYVSGNVTIYTNQYLNVETVLPTTYMEELARVDGQVSLAISTLSPTFSVDGLFPNLHTIGTKLDLQFGYSPSDAPSAVSAVGICPCLETASVVITRNDNGFAATLNLQGAFPHLVESSPTAFSGVEIGEFNVINSTGAFPVLALVHRRLGLRPFPYGCDAPPIYPALTTIDGRIDMGQNAIGVDFSACLPALATSGAILMQQSDGCIFPPFSALTSIVSTAIAPGTSASLAFTDNVNGAGPIPSFPVLNTVVGTVSFNGNSLATPAAWSAFPSLTRIGPSGGPYRDFSFQQNNGVLFAAGMFPSLLFVDDVTIADNVGTLSLQDAFAAVQEANNIAINVNDISSMVGMFADVVSATSLHLFENTGSYTLDAAGGAFASLTLIGDLLIGSVDVISGVDTGLSSVTGAFPVLNTISGKFNLLRCSNLTSIQDFAPAVSSITGDLIISYNSLLTMIDDSFNGLSTLGGLFLLQQNTIIASLTDSFQNLLSISANFTIYDIPSVTGSFGLLTTVTGSVGFNDGFSSTDLNGAFASLTTILGGNLTVFRTGATSLSFPSLTGLLTLTVKENLSLVTIMGMAPANGGTGGNAEIRDNPALPTVSQAQALIADWYADGGGGTESGNGPG